MSVSSVEMTLRTGVFTETLGMRRASSAQFANDQPANTI